MTMMETFNAIIARNKETRESVIKGHFFEVKEDCASEYNGQITIPAGCYIQADFAGDFGMYGVAEIDEVLHKVKVPLDNLHKIDFGMFDMRAKEATQ